MSRLGGRPHYVMPAGLFWPNDISFSPDGKFLAGTAGFSLFVVDLKTGLISWPDYTQNYVGHVDWSPDGRTLVLTRWYDPLLPEDSSGVHLYDVKTQVDKPFLDHGRHVYGQYCRWSPDGACFVLSEVYFTPRVAIYGWRDSSVSVVWPGAMDDGFEDLGWVPAGVFGRSRIALRKSTGAGQGSYLIDLEGSHAVKLACSLLYAAISPTRPELLTWGWSGHDSLGVLAVETITPEGVPLNVRLLAPWYPPNSSGWIARSPW